MIDYRIVIVGIICLTIIETIALLNGINGQLLTMIVGIIALSIGVTLPNPVRFK